MGEILQVVIAQVHLNWICCHDDSIIQK